MSWRKEIREALEVNYSEQLWVKLSDIRQEDLDKIVEIFTDVTGMTVPEGQKPNIEELHEQLPSEHGLTEWVLCYRGNVAVILSARRRIGAEGELFARFGVDHFFSLRDKHLSFEEKTQMQRDALHQGINNYFSQRRVAVSLRDTF